jgi:hypothetical protein
MFFVGRTPTLGTEIKALTEKIEFLWTRTLSPIFINVLSRITTLSLSVPTEHPTRQDIVVHHFPGSATSEVGHDAISVGSVVAHVYSKFRYGIGIVQTPHPEKPGQWCVHFPEDIPTKRQTYFPTNVLRVIDPALRDPINHKMPINCQSEQCVMFIGGPHAGELATTLDVKTEFCIVQLSSSLARITIKKKYLHLQCPTPTSTQTTPPRVLIKGVIVPTKDLRQWLRSYEEDDDHPVDIMVSHVNPRSMRPAALTLLSGAGVSHEDIHSYSEHEEDEMEGGKVSMLIIS